MRQFFLERVEEESVLSGQAFMYLHYADMIANGYVRTMPCPFRSQGLLLNPDGMLYYCENSKAIGNVRDGRRTRSTSTRTTSPTGTPSRRRSARTASAPAR